MILLSSKPITLLLISMIYKIHLRLKLLWLNSTIRSLLLCSISLYLISKYIIKSLLKLNSLRLSSFQKKLSKKYLKPYKIISQPDTWLFTLCLPKFICFVYLVFYILMFELVIFNTFSNKSQSVPTLIIINEKSEYKILWIVDSKIDYQ